MVFEILGVNLLEIMKRYDYKGIPLPLVRRMTKQVLIGLDYLHRKCRIIHTDLKPENVIVALSKESLQEIMDRGCISSMNKTVKMTNVMKDTTALFQAPAQETNTTLLANVDTTGMSKLQKKKLKKKLKKQMQENQDEDAAAETDQETNVSSQVTKKSGFQTSRDQTNTMKKSPPKAKKQSEEVKMES